MKQPLVSIIIPTYNRANLIGETLDSVLAQTYTNWECIIVDDGSTDHTDEVLKGYLQKDSRFKYHERPHDKPKGGNACRNYGFGLSKGDYILFLDSDDILKNTCLENRLNLIKNSVADFVVANTSYYERGVFGEKAIFGNYIDYSTSDYLKDFLSYKLPWTIMSVLWKRDSIKSVYFDSNLLRFQDVDFHIQVLLKKILNFSRLNEIDNYYRLDIDKKIDNNFINKVLSSFNVVFKKYDILLEKENYGFFKIFNYKIHLEFIIPFFYENKKISNIIFFNMINSKMYSINQKFYFFIFLMILNLNLINVKNVGVNSLRTKFKKAILS